MSVDEGSWLVARFEENRKHLRSVAYRMLGSLSEADDAVQDAWLRLSRSDASSVENLAGWLTTVVARVCLDMLRARRSRAEEPGGARVPDPIIWLDHGVDPEREAPISVSVAIDSRESVDPAVLADDASAVLPLLDESRLQRLMRSGNERSEEHVEDRRSLGTAREVALNRGGEPLDHRGAIQRHHRRQPEHVAA